MARPEWEEDIAWQDQALCRGADANLFFSPQHQESKEERVAREEQAKAVCQRCPVLMQCREFALTTREPYGVWGGLGEIERRHMLERQVG